MRTIQVINVRWFNATAWYALTLSKLLLQAGHDALVITLPGTDTDAQARQWSLPVQSLDCNSKTPLGQARLCFHFQKLIKEQRPDIVNCHRGEGFIHWGLLKGLTKRFGLVRTRGDQRLPRNNSINRWLHSSAADAVVATNTAMADHFKTSLQIPPERVWTIRGGVDRSRFRNDPHGRQRIRQEFDFSPEHRVIGLLGRFDRVKGQKELLQALALLRGRPDMEQVRLLLIGFATATSLDQVTAWISEFGLQGLVHITGKRTDIPACISALDLGVVASLWSETIARAALEIMSCGVPLISTRVGVMPDLLDSHALVQPANVQALADLIASGVANEDFRSDLVTRQRKVIDALSEKNFLEQTLAMYSQALARR